MRIYDDLVDVRRGWVADSATEGPVQFLWRGRWWRVRQILSSWVETGHWWQATHSDLLAERELWRVEARRADGSAPGVFDLSFSWTDGSWRLVGCLD